MRIRKRGGQQARGRREDRTKTREDRKKTRETTTRVMRRDEWGTLLFPPYLTESLTSFGANEMEKHLKFL